MTWIELEDGLASIEAAASTATSEDECRAVGISSREFLTTLARHVFEPSLHVTEGETQPGPSHAEAMLIAFFQYTLAGSSHEAARRFATAVVTLANAETHRRPATPARAQTAYVAVEAVAKFVRAAGGDGLMASGIPWAGLLVRGRYFAWDGPTLHRLEDRPAISVPPELLDEPTRREIHRQLARGEGGYGPPNFQVFETDRGKWRRALLQEGMFLEVRPSQ